MKECDREKRKFGEILRKNESEVKMGKKRKSKG